MNIFKKTLQRRGGFIRLLHGLIRQRKPCQTVDLSSLHNGVTKSCGFTKMINSLICFIPVVVYKTSKICTP